MEMVNNSVYCFRADRDGEQGRPGTEDSTKEKAAGQQAIFCKACGMVITSRNLRVAVAGSHSHAFFNPAGIAFEIGCFKSAPGCRVTGAATDEFTWFAGYHWRFASCRQCKAHLGWFYEMAEHAFFGLILTSLAE